MAGYLQLIASQLGISFPIFLGLLVWSASWKLVALWKAARKKHLIWFIILALINTFGILEILYIFIFSNHHKHPAVKEKKPAKKVKRTSTKKRR
jgi:hypothetical protein